MLMCKFHRIGICKGLKILGHVVCALASRQSFQFNFHFAYQHHKFL
ncbi:Uncharacterised protein [Chlamydia trachomatis]|nr:Uncharacterised protein [Chlamydia trachomatis]SSZ02706.1 Uncharacterised protein [Fannyhessea vaginae]